MTTALEAPQGRILALDRFRGLCLALMLAFGASKMFAPTSHFFISLSTHDLSLAFQLIQGYGFYDVIAPMFFFASGLSFGISYRAKVNKLGRKESRKKSVQHAFEVIGIGGLVVFNTDDPVGIALLVLMILCLVAKVLSYCKVPFAHKISPLLRRFVMDLGIFLVVWNILNVILFACDVTAFTHHWGPLCSIGVGMLLAIAVVEFKPLYKVLVCLVATACYATMCFALPTSWFDAFVHGGIMGALGYALLFVLAETMFSLRRTPYLACAFYLLIGIFAYLATMAMTPSKEAVNISYVLLSFVIDACVYMAMTHLEYVQWSRFPILATIGKYSLTLYCMHFAVSNMYGIAFAALVGYWGAGEVLSTIMLALAMLLYLVLITCAIRAMAKRNWIIRL